MPKTQYLWDMENDSYLAELDETGTVTADFTCSPEHFGRVVSEHRDGHTYHHHYDALGSTRALTDESGTVTDTFDYDAWGNAFSRTGVTQTTFKWNGMLGYWTDRFDNVSVRYRNYEPEVGRWTSLDVLLLDFTTISSIAFTYTVSYFMYVADNPVRHTDPSGAWYDGWGPDMHIGEQAGWGGAGGAGVRGGRAGWTPRIPTTQTPALRPQRPPMPGPNGVPKAPQVTPTSPVVPQPALPRSVPGGGGTMSPPQPPIPTLAPPAQAGGIPFHPPKLGVGTFEPPQGFIDSSVGPLEVHPDLPQSRRCSENRRTCAERWGFEACPQPARRLLTVLYPYLDSITSRLGLRHTKLLPINCYPAVDNKPVRKCPSDGRLIHCKLAKLDVFGLRTVDSRSEVSVFCCNCCHATRRDEYCHGPHPASHSRELDSDVTIA